MKGGGDGFVPASCRLLATGSGDEAVPAPFMNRPWRNLVTWAAPHPGLSGDSETW